MSLEAQRQAEVLALMKRMGGKFEVHLARLMEVADEENQAILLQSFSSIFVRFGEHVDALHNLKRHKHEIRSQV